MADIDSFREKLQTLITKFEKDKTHYLSKGYPEAQVRVDFINPSEKAFLDKLVSPGDLMLDLHKKENALPPSAERERIEREVAVTDEKIDEIVYGLYGVTEEERKIIETSK